jgi:hypothetical protein
VDLQHHAVVEAHPRHLDQHVAAETVGLRGRAAALDRLGVERLDRGPLEPGGGRADMAVVGRGRAELAEVGAPVLVRAQVAGEAGDVLAGDLAERATLPAKPSASGSITGSGR